jgi:hypothetical protein
MPLRRRKWRYTLVFAFINSLTGIGSASLTNGTGSISSSVIGSNLHQYVVNLTGVSRPPFIVNRRLGNPRSLMPLGAVCV